MRRAVSLLAVLSLAVGAALASTASAAVPDTGGLKGMMLAPADLKVRSAVGSQRAYKEDGAPAYTRELRLTQLRLGAKTRALSLAQDLILTPSAADGAQLVALFNETMKTKAGKAELADSFASGIGKDQGLKRVTVNLVPHRRIGDASVLIRLHAQFEDGGIDAMLGFFAVDRILSRILVFGIPSVPLLQADILTTLRTGVKKIFDHLEPSPVGAPTLGGTATVGLSLSVITSDDDEEAISRELRWERCDAAGANCVDTGSRSSSYTIVEADAGSTIRVVLVVATRFGTVQAASAVTAVVQPAAPPPA